MAVALRHRRDWRNEPVLHDCKQCRNDPKLRLAWGCESETETVQVGIPCQECGGGSRGCCACDDTEVEAIRRCPLALLWPETIGLMRLHAHWPERLARAGGLLDQDALYLDAMELIDRALYELREQDERNAEAMKGNGGRNA